MAELGSPDATGNAEELFAGPGEMRARCRALDWSATPIGPVSAWSSSLRVAVGTVMASPQAMCIGWGPALIQIYNDAYTRLNDRTPGSLGRPTAETWADVWHVIGPEMESVRDGGPAVLQEDRLTPFRSGDTLKDFYWTSSYSPIPDASAPHGVGGVLCFAAETTARVRAELGLRTNEERQAFLLKLGDALRPISKPVAIQATATRLLGEHLKANRVCYVEMSETESVVHQDYVSGVRSIAGRWRNDDFGKAMEQALRTGHTNVVSDIRALPGLSDAERASYEAIEVRAQIVVTLFKEGLWLANFGVHSASPREWTKLEVQLTQETAERTWSAVERARADAASRNSEEKYRTLFESIDEGFLILDVIYDREGRPVDAIYLESNPAAAKLTSVRDLIGHRLSEVMPGSLPDALEIYDRVARTGIGERHERYHPPSNRWYEGHMSPVANVGAAADARRVAVVFQDITERKRAEAALREKEERQAFLLKLSDDFRASPGEDAVGQVCVQALAAYMGVERCYITELSSELSRGLVGPEYYKPSLVPVAGEHRYTNYPKAMRDLKNGRPFVTSDVDNDPGLSDTDRASIAGGLGVQAMISTPLYEGAGNSIWALSVGSVKPRPWTDEELRLVQDVTERTWAAIARARAQRLALEEAERLIAARTAERDAVRRQLAQAEEAERRRLARELHDQLGQELTAFRLGLEDAVRLIPANSDDGPFLARISQLQRLADRMLLGARYISLELRPAELDDFGFASALETYVREWAARYDIDAEVLGVKSDEVIPNDAASALYRIAQEALTNVAKHANATSVSVIVERANNHVRLIIEDDGRGFDVEANLLRARAERRLGLGGMKERASLLGGTVEIESSEGSGSSVFVSIPLATGPV